MNTDERIAAALERIAAAIEARQHPIVPKNLRRNIQADSPVGAYEEKLRAIIAKLPRNQRLTMNELLSACGIEAADKGARASMGYALGRCGFRQVKTAKQRFYVLQ